MPTRLSILHTNHADTATLSENATAQTVFPVALLKTIARSERARTNGLSSRQWRASWAANVSIQAVVLAHHNLTSAATWRIRLYTDAAFTTLASGSDTGNVIAFDATGVSSLFPSTHSNFRELRNAVHWYNAPITARSMTIDFVDAANPDGHISAARLLAGEYRELDWNFDWGHPMTRVSKATASTALSGDEAVQHNGPMKRRFEISLAGMGQADIDFIADLVAAKDRGGDMFVSAFPGDANMRKRRDYAMWARIEDARGIEQPLLNYYGSSVVFGAL